MTCLQSSTQTGQPTIGVATTSLPLRWLSTRRCSASTEKYVLKIRMKPISSSYLSMSLATSAPLMAFPRLVTHDHSLTKRLCSSQLNTRFGIEPKALTTSSQPHMTLVLASTQWLVFKMFFLPIFIFIYIENDLIF